MNKIQNVSDELHDVIKLALVNMPSMPGIYKMLDGNKEILYIGKAKILKKRVSNYIKPSHSRTRRMISQVKYVEFVVTNCEAEAFLLESRLIKKHRPKFNILLKDDKSFPYIFLRLDHDFPQLLKYRGKNFKNGKFFGPYISSFQVDRTINELQKIFKLRSCSDNYFATRQRPCLQYQIKRCCGPCTGKIEKPQYQELIKEVEAFLEGKTNNLQTKLADKMNKFSENMQYESAAEIRDRIKALSYVQLRATPFGSKVKDVDVIVLIERNSFYCIQVFVYRNGQSYGNKSYFPVQTEGYSKEDTLSSFLGQFYQNKPAPKEIIVNYDLLQTEIIEEAIFQLHQTKVKITNPKRGDKYNLIKDAYQNGTLALDEHISKQAKNLILFEEIKNLFGLDTIPNRIEVYDNSHIMGKFALGGMIVVTPDGFEKKEYRSFNIKNVDENSTGGDDYAMMREVMTRRLSRIILKENEAPDLIIIDGGKGHLSVVREVMNKLEINIPLVAMSKGVLRNAGLEQFHIIDQDSFTLDKNNKLMKYLQIIRDEAHNYVINKHRLKRSKAISVSSLEKIENIGPIRKNALLNYFGSYNAITNASIEELEKIQGISKSLAKSIFESLHV